MTKKFLLCPYCGGNLKLVRSFDGCDYECEAGEKSGYKYSLKYECIADDCAYVFPIIKIKTDQEFSEYTELYRAVAEKGNC